MFYEVIELTGQKLPFIFHINKVTDKTVDFTHWHDNIELLYFYEGCGNVVCNLKNEYVEKGDVYVIGSNNLHSVKTDTSIKYYCLIVDLSFCLENGIDFSKMDFSGRINNDEVREMFDDIVYSYKNRSQLYEAKIILCVLKLLIFLCENFIHESTDENKNIGKIIPMIKNSINYIKENLTKHISIDDIARETGYSKSHFSRCFKQVTGITPLNYINIQRCLIAENLIRKSNLSVYAAALEVGFSNASYFSRTYKKIIGRLPSVEIKPKD